MNKKGTIFRDDLALTVQETSLTLKLARNTVYRLVATRVLPSLRIHGTSSIRIPRAALERWIELNTQGAECLVGPLPTAEISTRRTTPNDADL